MGHGGSKTSGQRERERSSMTLKRSAVPRCPSLRDSVCVVVCTRACVHVCLRVWGAPVCVRVCSRVCFCVRMHARNDVQCAGLPTSSTKRLRMDCCCLSRRDVAGGCGEAWRYCFDLHRGLTIQGDIYVFYSFPVRRCPSGSWTNSVRTGAMQGLGDLRQGEGGHMGEGAVHLQVEGSTPTLFRGGRLLQDFSWRGGSGDSLRAVRRRWCQYRIPHAGRPLSSALPPGLHANLHLLVHDTAGGLRPSVLLHYRGAASR